MPGWLEAGETNQGAADIGRWAQVSFPVDCMDDGHCDDGEFCNGQEFCSAGHCQEGPPPECGVGCTDCNSNGVPDECEPDCNSNGIADDCECFPNDYDRDGDSDLADFVHFQSCFSASGGDFTFDCACAFDLDSNGSVDLDDFGLFNSELSDSGPQTPCWEDG